MKNLVKETWNCRFFGPMYTMVWVISLWEHILYRNREPTLWLIVPEGSILGPLKFLIYVNDIPQAVKSNVFLYTEDSCFIYHHRDVEEIEKQLNKDFWNVCDWFVDNKLRIHFGEDKTKSILFASKHKIKRAWKSNIKYKEIKHLQVTYLGCVLDETLSGKPMAIKALNKVNGKLKFLFFLYFFSYILIMPVLHGTLTSMKNEKRKYKLHKISVSYLLKIGQNLSYIQQRV